MPSYNRATLIGNLTRDVEKRTLQGGSVVGSFGLACNKKFKTKEGEVRESVLFIDVTVWGRTADNCAEYLRKGSLVHVDGELVLDTWDDKTTGEKRSKIKLTAEAVQFLDGKSRDDDRREAEPRSQPASTPQQSRRPPAVPPKHNPEHDDDEIPF